MPHLVKCCEVSILIIKVVTSNADCKTKPCNIIILPYEFDLPDGVDLDDFDAVVDYMYSETGCTATAYRYNRDSSVEPNDPYWDFN